MNDRDLMTLPGWKQRDMVVSGELSSRELVEASLRRIEALDDRIHAFVTVDREGALGLRGRRGRGRPGGVGPGRRAWPIPRRADLHKGPGAD